MAFKRIRRTYGSRKPATTRRRFTRPRRYPASRTVRSRPARFGFSRRSNRFNRSVAKAVRGVAETHVIPLRQSDWIQPVAVSTGLGITAVKFVTGSTPGASFGSYLAQGGFSAPQGTGKNNRTGQFIWLKQSTVNLSIQLDYVTTTNRPGPITFRVICYKLKRALSPAGTTISPDNNLFLRNDGSNYGDATLAPNNMDQMDMALSPLNTNNFRIIKDMKINLCHTQNLVATSAPTAIQTNMKDHCNLRFNLKHISSSR